MPERTLILVKPDAVQRNLIGDVISRIERKGLRVIAMDLRTIDRETAQAHYAEHAEPLALNSGNYVTDQVALHGVGLDQD